MSYIAANDVLAMTAVIFCMVWLGFVTDASRIGKIVPGVVVVLSLGTLLSNLHVTAFSSTVADFIGQYIVAAAIPLLMIKADLKRIFVESGRVMLGFAAACVGIVIGVGNNSVVRSRREFSYYSASQHLLQLVGLSFVHKRGDGNCLYMVGENVAFAGGVVAAGRKS